jgi:hypothetical protein
MPSISITYTLDNTTESNYNYDTDKIEFTPTGARLKLIDNINQLFSQPFTTDTGFTYDSDKTEFVAGQCQQKDQAPANSTCWATYTSSIDLSYGDGVVTGTPTGGAAVSGGKLNLTGGTVKYVDHDATANADSQQVGAIKMEIIPNYTGFPVASRAIFTISKASGDNKNTIYLYHSVLGQIYLTIIDSAGVYIINAANLGPWSPTAGVGEELELNWDITTGATRLFREGNQQGATQTATGIRDSAIGLLRIGGSLSGTVTTDYEIDNPIIFNSVQHTANYTPGYTLEETKYLEDLITLPEFVYSGLGTIQSFDNFTTFQTGLIRMNINGEYWTGSAWASSDDSYAQMNDPATIIANISSLAASDSVIVKMRTQNSATQLSITFLSIGYTGQIYPLDNPTIEIKVGVIADAIYAWEETIVTKPANTELKHIIPRSPALYWNALAWISSDSTFAQANTAVEIDTNVGTLDISSGNMLRFLTFLNSDGTDTPIVRQLTLEFDFYDDSPLPAHTILYGQSVSMEPALLEGTTIKVNSYNQFMHGNNIVMIAVSTETNANGDFEMKVVETETVNINTFVQMEHTIGTETSIVIYDNVIIPNVESVSLETLLAGKSPRGR